ncbi:hypothetical protein [Kistimonas asteriae]|uniref:hypothetical protein n=1 Tax=Kistimonas asteriae TaxID=517724 RepID=UPI001BAC7E0F|nr:hypothetical protein [Kistimonas asteriae]
MRNKLILSLVFVLTALSIVMLVLSQKMQSEIDDLKVEKDSSRYYVEMSAQYQSEAIQNLSNSRIISILLNIEFYRGLDAFGELEKYLASEQGNVLRLLGDSVLTLEAAATREAASSELVANITSLYNAGDIDGLFALYEMKMANALQKYDDWNKKVISITDSLSELSRKESLYRHLSIMFQLLAVLFMFFKDLNSSNSKLS